MAIRVDNEINFTIEGIQLTNTVGGTATGILVASSNGATIHSARFQDLQLNSFPTGVVLGATGNPVSRCTFINTRFVTCTTAGVLLANAQDICFIEPEFTNCGYGIQSTSAGANFAVYGGVSTGQTSADCYVSSGGTLILDGHRSAGSNRFLNAAIGTSLCAIKLAACTVAASTNGDGICVQASGAFALTLESCKVFGQISTSEPTAVRVSACSAVEFWTPCPTTTSAARFSMPSWAVNS